MYPSARIPSIFEFDFFAEQMSTVQRAKLYFSGSRKTESLCCGFLVLSFIENQNLLELSDFGQDEFF